MTKRTQSWDLSNPRMARDFLKNLRIGPDKAAIEFLVNDKGENISIDDATDEQILYVVSQIAEAAGGGNRI